MKITELLDEIRDAALDGLQGLFGLGLRGVLALLALLVALFISLPEEERVFAVGFLLFAVGIGIFLRIRRG